MFFWVSFIMCFGVWSTPIVLIAFLNLFFSNLHIALNIWFIELIKGYITYFNCLNQTFMNKTWFYFRACTPTWPWDWPKTLSTVGFVLFVLYYCNGILKLFLNFIVLVLDLRQFIMVLDMKQLVVLVLDLQSLILILDF